MHAGSDVIRPVALAHESDGGTLNRPVQCIIIARWLRGQYACASVQVHAGSAPPFGVCGPHAVPPPAVHGPATANTVVPAIGFRSYHVPLPQANLLVLTEIRIPSQGMWIRQKPCATLTIRSDNVIEGASPSHLLQRPRECLLLARKSLEDVWMQVFCTMAMRLFLAGAARSGGSNQRHPITDHPLDRPSKTKKETA
ncbi:hypothetical protein LZ30DRAFT_694069 [Colletotrichum cereale]|nr:hypothetical protein LZ30DRAFT_694069 [Colletotrichum cereale]